MLSRTADCLYWMARYTERAENTARMLDVNYQTSLLPQPREFLEQSWIKLLSISHLENLFKSRYHSLTRENIFTFMISDPNNPSSIVSCLQAARENARAIRGKITSEVWETQNDTWLKAQQEIKSIQQDPSQFLEWVKYRSHLFRGVVYGTMLKNESFYFMRVGTYLERADNTARILESKYHIHSELNKQRQSEKENVALSESFDYYHWASLLRSVSAFEIYRQTYSDQITPQKIADLLILNEQMPRSLMHCISSLLELMDMIKNQDSKDIERHIGRLKAELAYADIHEIFTDGFDQFIEGFLEKINAIANEFSNQYLIPLAVA